jgi:arylsulfatase A-like enzyme
MKKLTLTLLGGSLAIAQANAQNITQQQQPFTGVVGQSSADSKPVWTDPVKASAGAPNIVWVLLDDVGFGATSTFGGVIRTPTLDSLANNGLRYTNFHTAAICAPTRAALLTGRNQHWVHEGGFSHAWGSFGYPGWDGRIPSDKGTVAEILREAGYNTFAVGKYGLTPDQDATDAGPFDRWPSGKGFDHFFGFLGSQTDQYKPDLVEDNAHVTPDGRHLTDQITDKAIAYIARQKKAAPDKPFFLYYAPAGTHAPHQVATAWSDQYKGKFDGGWDVFRAEVFKRQKQQGIIPANAVLPDRNPNIKAWNSLSADEKKLYARFMEVYAGYLTYTDHKIGQVVSYLKKTNQLDNTVIMVVVGDNGASKEGDVTGVIGRPSEAAISAPLSEAEQLKLNVANIAKIGTPEGTNANYPLGWAQAANTPFRFWKQDAHSEGGTRNPLIVFYPKGIKDKGTFRQQYGYVSDLLPTTLEFVGLKAPSVLRGIRQDTLQGTSLVYSFANAKAPSRHRVQYYYLYGARAIYQDGWKATLAHQPAPGARTRAASSFSVPNPANNDWQLYNLNEDFNERFDLAKKYPEKLAALKALFEEESKKNHVYPYITWDDVLPLRAPLPTKQTAAKETPKPGGTN